MSTINTETVNDLTVHKFPDIATYTANSSSVGANDIVEITPTSLQDKLVSGTNIKTINGESILGAGNIKSLTGNVITYVSYDMPVLQFDENLLCLQVPVSTTNVSSPLTVNSMIGSGIFYIIFENTTEVDIDIPWGAIQCISVSPSYTTTTCEVVMPKEPLTIENGMKKEVSIIIAQQGNGYKAFVAYSQNLL